ncbi:MAG: VIT and VWA domain-containing protein [Pirellulales bacterium]|nr:VIT and VWA domain-containing protein [Pirellulales bacterium]
MSRETYHSKPTRPRRWSHRLLAGAAALAVILWGGTGAPHCRAAGLLIADGGLGGVLEIQEQDVRVTINNGIAVTEVEQVFKNTEQRVVEALYTFPVPKRASVADFSMWIGGREMVGEVVEKERARQIYESYKVQKRDPGLLEQVDYKRFEMRICPIAAGAEQKVRVVYYQELEFDHDRASYTYPLATNTTTAANAAAKGRFSFALDVKSAVPISELKSPSHVGQFVVVRHTDPHYWQASLETSGGDLSRDVVINYAVEKPHTGVDLVTSKPAGEDGYFQLTITAGQELESKLKGSDYIFVIDVSGSMMNDGKLAVSRDAVAAFVESLGEDDRFELITFNIAANPLFRASTPVTTDSKARAIEFLRSQQAVGGTVLRPAIEAAYRYYDNDRQLNVVVLSDGMTQQGEQRELLALIGQRPAGASVFCVGVGNEVNRPLLDQLATETGGLAAFMSAGDDFAGAAQAFRRKLTRPAARNVKLSFAGGEVYDVEPQTLPNLFHGQPIRLYGRYKQSGPAKLQLSAEVLGAPLEQTVDVTLPPQDDSNPEIERMWALYRVERLMGQDRRTGSRGSFDEIVRLCEGYSIAGEYASFIVLENDAEYQRWKIERRNVTRVGRDRRAQAEVREQLAQLREQTAQQVGPAPADKLANKPLDSQPPAATPTELAQANPTTPDATPPNMSAPEQQRWTSGPTIVDESSQGSSRGRSGGGGAIDPVTALTAAGMGLAGCWGARRRRRRPKSSQVN